MQEIELEDQTAKRLLTVLEENSEAVGIGDCIRWTPDAAEQITDIKDTIAAQTEVEK